MKNNKVPFVIEMLIFFFIIMASFLVYTLLVKDTLNEYIEKYEETEKHVYELKDKSEHVYETKILTTDAVTLTCRVHYTHLDDNCPFEDTINCCESIIKYSSRSAFLDCYIVDVLSKQNIIKEKIKHKCYEESTKYSFELKIYNIEFIL